MALHYWKEEFAEQQLYDEGMKKSVEPSITKGAFSCPHCGAYTTQHWYSLRANELENGNFPPRFDRDFCQRLDSDSEFPEEHKESMLNWQAKLKLGLVFFERESGKYCDGSVYNLNLTACYNCKEIAVWVDDRIVFPASKVGVFPNSDLSEAIIADFEEARAIVNISPKGAAALLRLCIQKLCIHLGEKGKKIDDDIGSLVKKGLNPLVQKSLDIVRVIGNEAVHPGSINLNDDRDTALQLFDLVNAIADQMITHPKAVNELYDRLPDSKKKAIEARDKDAPKATA